MIVKVSSAIQIGGHLYQICFDHDLQDRNDWGEVNHHTQLITINESRLASQRTEALVHELLHVISRIFYHSNDDVTEQLIGSMSEGLTQVFVELGVELDWSDIKEKE